MIKYPNGSNFGFPINSAKMNTLMAYNPRLFNINVTSLPDTYYRFFEVGLGYFLVQGGSTDFGSSYDYDKYSDMLGGQLDPSSIESGASIKGEVMVHVLHPCTNFLNHVKLTAIYLASELATKKANQFQ